ncbi:hypothetical protein GCK32_013624, partial [Trichostrongylus colubriformis]
APISKSRMQAPFPKQYPSPKSQRLVKNQVKQQEMPGKLRKNVPTQALKGKPQNEPAITPPSDQQEMASNNAEYETLRGLNNDAIFLKKDAMGVRPPSKEIVSMSLPL